MKPITVYKGKAAVLDRANVDTDQIIPKQFLKRIERTGFGEFLFYDWRFDEDGNEREDFELNQPQNKNAGILIAGENFGCGSSREHAPWSLQDYGFDIVIAPSFADIFQNNCLKNGMLPITLTKDKVSYLMNNAGNDQLTIDLREQTVIDNKGLSTSFDIHPYWKEMLLNGWDEISITLQYSPQIDEFEKSERPISTI
ncbi:3-isopropylmalate dehydratase small subunit [Peribacillus cavernae]|uniref:3-isopropylmalate dehydratase small subunit n=1 Tax=Peribacillus cavernae TaxID=1674310 RepID=A0A3S0TTP9_9BACI|nr:3-isopropylmalate dehydratase small subunit [Peribacillus cavernae]MDQ0219403.1 3-isopropylmalate/(R)-2-methylmalate dehydratase small subunit [Peribacillus cavernae]RUQ27722.1 3-isopropylmalate dehydratase small subunit [Peribacillus cavernae]